MIITIVIAALFGSIIGYKAAKAYQRKKYGDKMLKIEKERGAVGLTKFMLSGKDLVSR